MLTLQVAAHEPERENASHDSRAMYGEDTAPSMVVSIARWHVPQYGLATVRYRSRWRALSDQPDGATRSATRPGVWMPSPPPYMATRSCACASVSGVCRARALISRMRSSCCDRPAPLPSSAKRRTNGESELV